MQVATISVPDFAISLMYKTLGHLYNSLSPPRCSALPNTPTRNPQTHEPGIFRLYHSLIGAKRFIGKF